MSAVTRAVVTGVLVLSVAACTETSVGPASGPARSATSGTTSTTPVTPTTRGAPVVNGRITSVQRHLRRDDSSYYWLAFDATTDTGLVASHRFCRQCRPRGVEAVRFTALGPRGRVGRIVCAEAWPCRAHRTRNVATLGPGADEVTVRRSDRRLDVFGYDGRLRRSIDLAGGLDERDDIGSLAWSPDGDHLAVLTHRGRRRTDVWLVQGGGSATLAYTFDNPFAAGVAWSPDGRSLVFEALLPSRRHRGWVRNTGADVVVLRRSPVGRSSAMTLQTRYRSDRHFDWAGNLAWSPDGTRIAVRVHSGVAEISAEDGTVLTRHPQTRRLGGWLIWLERHR